MKQMSLFNEPTVILPVTYYPQFLTLVEADDLYQHCQELQWQQNQIRMLGKTMPVPRLALLCHFRQKKNRIQGELGR